MLKIQLHSLVLLLFLKEDKMTLEEIKKALQDRIISKVAEATGLNPHTIYRIQKGKHKPNIGTMKLLARYLKGEENAD